MKPSTLKALFDWGLIEMSREQVERYEVAYDSHVQTSIIQSTARATVPESEVRITNSSRTAQVVNLNFASPVPAREA